MDEPRSLTRTMLIALAASAIASCVYYEPVAVHQPGPSKFDRSWEAARAAAEDVGVTITDVDRARGTIQGYTTVSPLQSQRGRCETSIPYFFAAAVMRRHAASRSDSLTFST